MPFSQMSQEEQRRRLVHRVLVESRSVASVAREFGVSRPTAYHWLNRARQDKTDKQQKPQKEEEQPELLFQEQSRCPHHSPAKTEVVSPEIEALIRECQSRHPRWGARKLHAVLWPPSQTASQTASQAAPICARTVHRILKRQGLLASPSQKDLGLSEATQRFERDNCNELWQVDYKGVKREEIVRQSPPATAATASIPSTPLSIVDDCSRFCIALTPVFTKTGEAAWNVLWEAFGQYGLPECLLCDNGDGFNNTRSLGPTWLQARLWRLGIRTTHGRPRHPQTQGKVERFHRTISVEVDPAHLGDKQALSAFRHCYNWSRPHEALEMRVPGAVYKPSSRLRPDQLTEAESYWASTDAIVRKVDSYGKISYKNCRYHPGRGLSGEWVEIREEAQGKDMGMAAFYAGVRFAALDDLLIP